MSLRSLSRILRQFDNTLNRVGRDMMMREGGRFPSALAPVSRMMSPTTATTSDRDLWTPFPELESSLLPEWSSPSRVMPVDVIEKDKEYQISIDMPAGLSKDDVTVEKSKRDHTITVSCERSEEETTKDDYYCIKERAWGVMKRIINIPENVDMDNINVKFESAFRICICAVMNSGYRIMILMIGILKMALPKAEPSLPEKEKLSIEG